MNIKSKFLYKFLHTFCGDFRVKLSCRKYKLFVISIKKCKKCRKIAVSTPCGSGKKYKQCCGK